MDIQRKRVGGGGDKGVYFDDNVNSGDQRVVLVAFIAKNKRTNLGRDG